MQRSDGASYLELVEASSFGRKSQTEQGRTTVINSCSDNSSGILRGSDGAADAATTKATVSGVGYSLSSANRRIGTPAGLYSSL